MTILGVTVPTGTTTSVARVFVTGGTGVIGTALVGRLLARGDEVVGLARSDAAAATLETRGVQVVRGEGFDVEVLTRGMAGCASAYNVAGVNSLCIEDPRPMERLNVDGAAAAVRAAARAGVARLVHTSSAATIGEPPGTVGTEQTSHRGWYLSAYERTKTEGERAALAAAGEVGQDLVLVNPSSVQGPGRAGGTARFFLAFLDGRLKVFVPTTVSLVDIDDCAEGHLLACERGVAGQRYLLNGMTLPIDQALGLAAEVAGVPRNGQDAAPRPPLRRLARRAGPRPPLHGPEGNDPQDGGLGPRRGLHQIACALVTGAAEPAGGCAHLHLRG